MLMSLRIQPCIFDKLEKAMAILAYFFLTFCLQVMKSFCKLAECQYEFYGFNLL